MAEQTTEEQKTNEAAAPAEKPAAPPLKAILGRKVGMTRIYDAAGRFIPVTVLKAGPCAVTQVKTKANDGYEALQLAFGPAKPKNVSKPMAGHFAKAGAAPALCVREVRVEKTDGFQVGQEIRAVNFAEGDLVDVSGVNKGKGYAGVMKRHRFHGGPRTHGQSDRARAPGSSGGQQPQKVFKGRRNPGHMGAEWSTVQRLSVVKVDAEQDLLLLEGSVPGPNGSFLTVQKTSRPRKFRKVAPPAAAAKKSGKPVPAKPAAPAAKK
ncbi:MAG: 50S ribosomal protein L3 [Elusimicrobiota bacterium]|jgi:large subunit ribosomal protein L3